MSKDLANRPFKKIAGWLGWAKKEANFMGDRNVLIRIYFEPQGDPIPPTPKKQHVSHWIIEVSGPLLPLIPSITRNNESLPVKAAQFGSAGLRFRFFANFQAQPQLAIITNTLGSLIVVSWCRRRFFFC